MDKELQENINYYLANQPTEEIINLGVPFDAHLMLTCKGCDKTGEAGCTVYRSPRALLWHRTSQYCPFNAPKVAAKVQKINPLKASKRGV
jgi:hypothetical protein